MGDWTRDLTNIAVMFISVAALALVVSHAQGTATVIGSASSGFGSLLSTVENPQGSSGASNTGTVGMQNYGSGSAFGIAGPGY